MINQNVLFVGCSGLEEIPAPRDLSSLFDPSYQSGNLAGAMSQVSTNVLILYVQGRYLMAKKCQVTQLLPFLKEESIGQERRQSPTQLFCQKSTFC